MLKQKRCECIWVAFLGALTERPPTERPSDISTRMERPLDDWSTVTGRPLWQLDSKWTDCTSTPKMAQKVGKMSQSDNSTGCN